MVSALYHKRCHELTIRRECASFELWQVPMCEPLNHLVEVTQQVAGGESCDDDDDDDRAASLCHLWTQPHKSYIACISLGVGSDQSGSTV